MHLLISVFSRKCECELALKLSLVGCKSNSASEVSFSCHFYSMRAERGERRGVERLSARQMKLSGGGASHIDRRESQVVFLVPSSSHSGEECVTRSGAQGPDYDRLPALGCPSPLNGRAACFDA